MEGHPFFETSRGLEYLFGYCYRDDAGTVRYDAVWGRDREGERRAFERFVDWLVERRRRHPGMHVYHYAHYERTALTRLMGQHGTRETEIDDLLRAEVLVDLYRVTKQALRASVESYSIKAIEKLYGFERTADVAGGDESIVRFEEWVESGDDSILEEVERYNEEDCRSTYALHEWLLGIRPPGLPWRDPPELRPRKEELVQRDAERAALEERLLAGAEEGTPRRLLGHLVDYHQREARPQWWAWFRWPQLDDDELVADRTAIGRLAWDGRPPEVEGTSHAYRFTFPEQEHKLETKGSDPDTRLGLSAAGRRRPRRRDPAAADQARGGAAPARPDARGAVRRRRQARGPDAVRPRLRRRRARSLPRAHRAARAACAAGLARRRSRGRGAVAPRELPLRPGAAGLGQDVAGSADGDRADAGGEARSASPR